MFNLKEAAGDNPGYQLRITYDAKDGLYTVNGYLLYTHNGLLEHDRDGASLHFTTMREAMDWILNYPEPKVEKQLSFNFEREGQ